MAAPRRTLARCLDLGAALLAGAVLLAGAGCAGTVPNETAGPSAASSGVDGFGAGPTPSAGPATTATPKPSPTTAPAGDLGSYPGSAKAYAEAALSAWASHLVNRLGDLTTPLVQEQILEIPGPPNQQWTYQQCDGAAGSSYCSFINADGDAITLRVSNQQVGKAHAVTEITFDQTVYSNDATAYVKAFLTAWRNGNIKRMQVLSNQTEVEYFTHYAPPDSYTVCKFQVGQVWQVRIYHPDGLYYLVRVTIASLGTKHAITGHIDPVPFPPVCG